MALQLSLLLAAALATLLLAALLVLRRKQWPFAPGRPLRTMVVLGSGWLPMTTPRTPSAHVRHRCTR
jgi:hypothetical protein